MKSRSLIIVGLYAVVIAALTYIGWQVLTYLADWFASNIDQAQNGGYFRTQNYRDFAQWLTPISVVIVLLGGLFWGGRFAVHSIQVLRKKRQGFEIRKDIIAKVISSFVLTAIFLYWILPFTTGQILRLF